MNRYVASPDLSPENFKLHVYNTVFFDKICMGMGNIYALLSIHVVMDEGSKKISLDMLNKKFKTYCKWYTLILQT